MIRPRFYHASDYAGVSIDGCNFYYGYEESKCTNCGNMTKRGSEYCNECKDADREWCFVATINGERMVIPFSELGVEDMFDVVGCLCVGMAILYTKKVVDIALNAKSNDANMLRWPQEHSPEMKKLRLNTDKVPASIQNAAATLAMKCIKEGW